MMDAEAGDDVFGEDPSVNDLQEKVAKLLNKEAALLVCLENTHNRAGGRVYPIEKTRETHSLAKRYGLAMHLDGARLMNASVAMGIPPDGYARYLDSVSICLSKGLGAPIGSIKPPIPMSSIPSGAPKRISYRL